MIPYLRSTACVVLISRQVHGSVAAPAASMCSSQESGARNHPPTVASHLPRCCAPLSSRTFYSRPSIPSFPRLLSSTSLLHFSRLSRPSSPWLHLTTLPNSSRELQPPTPRSWLPVPNPRSLTPVPRTFPSQPVLSSLFFILPLSSIILLAILSEREETVDRYQARCRRCVKRIGK